MNLHIPGIRVEPMSAADNTLATFELERKILRVLCGARDDASPRSGRNPESRARAVSGLLSYRWHDAEHRIVFEALASLPDSDAAELRRRLPAQAARMGFPDVCWETYFAGGTPGNVQTADTRRTELAALIAQLLAAATESSS